MLIIGQAEDISFKTFFSVIGGASGFTVLAAVTWAWLTRKIVTKGELDAAENRAKEWRELALRSLEISEQAANVTSGARAITEQVVAATPTRSSP